MAVESQLAQRKIVKRGQRDSGRTAAAPEGGEEGAHRERRRAVSRPPRNAERTGRSLGSRRSGLGERPSREKRGAGSAADPIAAADPEAASHSPESRSKFGSCFISVLWR